jgi:hypothetical protein
MKHMQMAAGYLKPVKNWKYQLEPIKDGLKMVLLKKISGRWLKDKNPKTS